MLQHIPLKKRIVEYPFSRFLDRIWDINILLYISFQCLPNDTMSIAFENTVFSLIPKREQSILVDSVLK
jgi:hypothetical protein